MTQSNENLAARLVELKTEIANYRAELAKIEAELVDRLAADLPVDKSRTYDLDGWKVTIKRPVTRKVDSDEWSRICQTIPADLRPMRVEYKPEKKGLDWLATNKPDIFRRVAGCISSTPGKPSVTVKEA